MDDEIILNEYEMFDEVEYLRGNPDVAASVSAGLFATGWHHYNAHGRAEGRRCNNFDERFYLQSRASLPTLENILSASEGLADISHIHRPGAQITRLRSRPRLVDSGPIYPMRSTLFAAGSIRATLRPRKLTFCAFG